MIGVKLGLELCCPCKDIQEPIQLRKGHEKVSVPCRKDEWTDVDGGYRLTTFLPPMM